MTAMQQQQRLLLSVSPTRPCVSTTKRGPGRIASASEVVQAGLAAGSALAGPYVSGRWEEYWAPASHVASTREEHWSLVSHVDSRCKIMPLT